MLTILSFLVVFALVTSTPFPGGHPHRRWHHHRRHNNVVGVIGIIDTGPYHNWYPGGYRRRYRRPYFGRPRNDYELGFGVGFGGKLSGNFGK